MERKGLVLVLLIVICLGGVTISHSQVERLVPRHTKTGDDIPLYVCVATFLMQEDLENEEFVPFKLDLDQSELTSFLKEHSDYQKAMKKSIRENYTGEEFDRYDSLRQEVDHALRSWQSILNGFDAESRALASTFIREDWCATRVLHTDEEEWDQESLAIQNQFEEELVK